MKHIQIIGQDILEIKRLGEYPKMRSLQMIEIFNSPSRITERGVDGLGYVNVLI